MNIIKLQAENIKKLKAVEITPEDNVIKITGKNEQGKSTVLDAIWWALGGTKNVQEEPIRRGEKAGSITLEIGDKNDPLHGLIVTRTFTEKGSYLKVENKDGAQFKSPQGILDQLIGHLSFDPLAFAKAEPAKQAETLLEVVDIKVDTAKLAEISGVKVEESDNPIKMLEQARKSVFDNRTDVNRDADRAKKALESMGAAEPAKSVSVTELVSEKERLESANRENEQKRQELRRVSLENETRQRAINEIENEIAELQRRLTSKKEELKQTIDIQVELAKGVNKLQDHDLTDVNNRITTADEQNRKAQKYAEYLKQKEVFMGHQTESETLTKKLEAIKAYKAELIKKTKFPVDGLDFVNGGVAYQGLPFSQASGAQKLQVSMAIAMASNPSLKIIRCDEGTWLDSDHMAILEKMAKDNDFQVWMVVPGEDGNVGVLIEDGMIAN